MLARRDKAVTLGTRPSRISLSYVFTKIGIVGVLPGPKKKHEERYERK